MSLVERGHPVRLSAQRELSRVILPVDLSGRRPLADRMSALRVGEARCLLLGLSNLLILASGLQSLLPLQ